MNERYSFKFMLTLVISASALTALILSIVFFAGFNTNRHVTIDSPAVATTVREHVSTEYERRDTDVSDFSELLDIIESQFIGTYDIDDIINYAMRAAVDSLDDIWSHYMSPEEYTEFLATANNRYAGIGVSVMIDEETEGMKVLGVYEGAGAYQAGIVIGDIVVAVDGESIIGLTLNEIRYKLRRPLGETADITVLRYDGEYHIITVEFSIVFVNPVSFEMLPGNIGYVRLRNFDQDAAENFIDAVNTLLDMGAVAFIYDVRNNGGGRVNEVTRILDFLLPEGEIFISVDRSGVENIIMSDENWIDMPAVVLVNSYSFSGAEFFAAMLYEYDYAATVGEQTTGKNRMQSTIPLSNGGAVHISTGHYLTKNRVSLFDIGGFTPQYVVEFTEEDRTAFLRGELDRDSDTQFQKALSLLENYR
ncbi:MAG: S41 family peptidase [Oscillospiraceae bacterium]|nr:S41 family peptidase [Oscillospiraceae bacterium]